MPTENRFHVRGDSDLGWGWVRVVAVDPDTQAPTLIRVTCKACRCEKLMAVAAEAGHVMDVFQHYDSCAVLWHAKRAAQDGGAHGGRA